jgi:hypothetical protein
MTQGGRRYSRKKRHTAKHVQTIPELRRAFEHIEQFGYEVCKQSMKDAIPAFQSEWKKTFYREIDKSAAEAYLDHLKTQKKHRRGTRKLKGGGATPLAGAPLDYTTRPGIYLTPGGINQNSYALVPKYVQSGFGVSIPEIAQSQDPVPGQTHYVTRTPAGMGSNAWPGAFGPVKGGKRRSKKQKGGEMNWGAKLSDAFSTSTVQQAMLRPFSSSNPTSIAFDAQSAWRGLPLPQSPDPTQTKLPYQMSQGGVKPMPDFNISPIRVNLMNDVQSA